VLERGLEQPGSNVKLLGQVLDQQRLSELDAELEHALLDGQHVVELFGDALELGFLEVFALGDDHFLDLLHNLHNLSGSNSEGRSLFPAG
jgi:hypothetical protein